MPSHPSTDARSETRLRLAPMYTLIRVRTQGQRRYRWTGYIYDISRSGMRFELDEALPAGTRVEVRATLPGSSRTTIHATGTVVRRHDDDAEPGPVRMGLAFDQFAAEVDQQRLADYLRQRAA